MGRPNCKLPFSDIIETVYYFLHCSKLSIRELRDTIGHSHMTIVDWNTQCREVCSLAVKQLPKLRDTKERPVQVDESNFSGRCKNDKGRVLKGEKMEGKGHRPPRAAHRRQERKVRFSIGMRGSLNRMSPSQILIQLTIMGDARMGPWVFGLYVYNTNV